MSPGPLDEVYAHSPRIVGRRIGDEYVLVPLVGRGADLDAILNLNTVGAFIWEHLDGQRDGSQVVKALVERFEVEPADAERDYVDFLATLRQLEVAVPVDRGQGPGDDPEEDACLP